MTQRLIALGAALSFAVSSIANAAPLPAASATVSKAAGGQAAATAWVDPPAKMAARPLPSAPAAPAAASSQALASVNEPAKTAPVREPSAAPAAEARVAAKEPPAVRQVAPAPIRQAAKPRVVRTARYAGGEGGAWRTGRDSFGFSGVFGGCRISGFAGPNGYRLDRAC